MAQQSLLLQTRQLFHGGFDFSERAHGVEDARPGATGNRGVVLVVQLRTW
jgi:hypothetical protein